MNEPRGKSEVNDELPGQTRIAGPGRTALSSRPPRAALGHSRRVRRGNRLRPEVRYSAAPRSDPTASADSTSASRALWGGGPGSAGERVDGGQRNLRQAPGAIPARADPRTRAARPPQSVRHGPAAGAVTQPSDGGSIAKAVAPATWIDDHQTRPVAQAAHS